MNATQTRSNIGRWAVIIHQDRQVVGTVMDLVSGSDVPKRIRIQRGPLQGEVVQPFEYEFKGWLDETQIDD